MREEHEEVRPGSFSPRASLWELALLCLKLGTTAFGGPAAHIAMMEEEVVRRRGWLSREQFLDLLGVTNLIPGPNSTEMALHIGYMQQGWAGLLVAGSCFILPAVFLVGVIAWAYVQFGTLPEVAGLLYGVKPVDPIVYGGVVLLFTLVAALACLVPSLRASRIDPLVALRSD